MKTKHRTWNGIIRKIFSFICFLAILLYVFYTLTYMFRNISYDKGHLRGLSDQKVDMVYIGGSASFVYWQPLKAWHDCGITSYLYSTRMIQAESLKYMLMECRQSQNPDLYVIDLRPFQYWSEDIAETGLRYTTDSMSLFSLNRYRLVYEYLNNRKITKQTDRLSYYLDMVKYHTNRINLSLPQAWKAPANQETSPNKGWEWTGRYAYLNTPSNFITDERTELAPGNKKTLESLLEYCSKEQLNVLFVVCPYEISTKHYPIYNTLKDHIEAYGFQYLNANDHYEEIGLDFSTDFYDSNHVNLFGAEKYTDFLENYLLENYSLTDHRGDEAYDDWNKEYNRFVLEKLFYQAWVRERIKDVQSGLEMASEMVNTANIREWYHYVSEERFTVLMRRKGKPLSPEDPLEENFLKEKLHMLGEQDGSMLVWSGEEVIASNALGTTDEKAEVLKGYLVSNASYQIGIEDSESASIRINNVEYSLDQEGLNIVVYDEHYKRVVDCVTLQCQNGKLILSR